MHKVSVVVPVYNGKNFIKRCMDSVLNQSYKNIELVMVNDGSKDESLSIMKELSKGKENVVIVDQKNGGVSSARNNGLDHSTGKFVTFVDVDDALKENAILNMVNSLKKDTDIVIGGLEIRKDDKVISRVVPEDNKWARLKYTSTQFKLYRRDFLIKNNILFEKKFDIGEDMLFFYKAMSNTTNIEVCERADYLNFKNDESVTANINKRKNMLDMYDVMKYMYDNKLLKNYNEKENIFLYMKITTLNVLLQINGFKISELKKLYNKNYDWVKSISANNKISLYNQEGETSSINLIINLFIIFKKMHLLGLLIFILGIFKINRRV